LIRVLVSPEDRRPITPVPCQLSGWLQRRSADLHDLTSLGTVIEKKRNRFKTNNLEQDLW